MWSRVISIGKVEVRKQSEIWVEGRSMNHLIINRFIEVEITNWSKKNVFSTHQG